MPFSVAILAAEGAGGMEVGPVLVGAAAPLPTDAAFVGAAPDDAIWPSTAPGVTVAPVSTPMAERTPEVGALTSSVTLSVSSSTKGSSAFTVSPGFLNHFATVASLTDSPSVGTLMSVPPAPEPAETDGAGSAWLP